MSENTAEKTGEARETADASAKSAVAEPYVLEQQIGHLLRRTHQRASAIFMAGIGESQFTPTQFAALAKLADEGAVSQNRLGRLTAMDPATMQGVVGRLLDRGLITSRPDPDDRRRTLLRLSEAGRSAVNAAIDNGRRITRDTLAPLSRAEQKTLLRLLKKLGDTKTP